MTLVPSVLVTVQLPLTNSYPVAGMVSDTFTVARVASTSNARVQAAWPMVLVTWVLAVGSLRTVPAVLLRSAVRPIVQPGCGCGF